MEVHEAGVVPLDEQLGRRVGILLKQTKTSDVVDAAVALLAKDGDEILTSDVRDLRPLVEAMGVHVELIDV